MRALWTAEGYSPDRPSIYDFRGVTDFDVSMDEVARAAVLSETLHAGAAPNRIALIVGNSDLGFGVARMGQPYSRFQGANIRVCRNDAEAHAWVSGRPDS